MRHGKFYGKHLAFGLALCLLPAVFIQAAAAPQDIVRPKKDIPKPATFKRAGAKPSGLAAPRQALTKKNAAPEPLAFDPASKTTFITYDIGTLRMVGKSPADATYRIGPLRMTGQAGAATYAIGTLSMRGKRER